MFAALPLGQVFREIVPRIGDKGKHQTTPGQGFEAPQLRMEESTMANRLADARRSLIRATESAQKRLEELEDERREIKASLKSLDAALKALGKPNRGRATNRPVIEDDGPDSEAAIDAS